MIYLVPEVMSGLGEDTFWTWFHREFPNSTFDPPPVDIGPNDVILQYSTMGPSKYMNNTLALMWELYPEMKVALNSNAFDNVIRTTERCGANAKRLVVTSELTIPFYSKLGRPIDLLPIGVDTDLFKPGPQDIIRVKYGLGLEEKIGFWCGTHHEMKGFQLLEQYRIQHPDIDWIVVWKDHTEYQTLDWAHTYCQLSQLELSELMSAADFFLCTNMLRPYFMIEWEAMACDLPFIDIGTQEREFFPSAHPREDIFARGWDRPSAKIVWQNYLKEHFNIEPWIEVPKLPETNTITVTADDLYTPRSCIMKMKPHITIASLIYKSPLMADWVHDSLYEFTPQLMTGEAEFYFVANDPTDELLAHLNSKYYRHYINYNPHLSDSELYKMGIGSPEYIRRVYRGWNYAISAAKGEIVVLVNSDHYFSPHWLDNLLKRLNDKTIVVSQLIEPRYSSFPRTITHDFGHPATGLDTSVGFDKKAFLELADTLSKNDAAVPGGVYMPCAFLKSVVEKAGYYPEGNMMNTVHLEFSKNLTGGDVVLFNKLSALGVNHITSLDSIVYHLDEGETRCDR
jgi:hypothetical protein